MHGGKSTGPRTEAGRARIRAARMLHGKYGSQTVAEVRRQIALMKELRMALRALDRGDEAGALKALGAVAGDGPLAT